MVIIANISIVPLKHLCIKYTEKEVDNEIQNQLKWKRK